MSTVIIPDSDSDTTTSTRITNPHLLLLARGLWIAFALFTIAVTLLNVPQMFDRPICQDSSPGCLDNFRSISQTTVDRLAGAGIDYRLHVVSDSIVALFMYIVFVCIAGVLFWQRSDDRMALLLGASWLCWFGISPITGSLSPIVALMVALTFPTGSFQPRWSVIIIVPMLAYAIAPALNLFSPTSTTAATIAILMIAITFVVMFYRYRHVLTITQRQQTKWLLFSVAFTGIYWFVCLVLILPLLNTLGNNTLLIAYFFAFNFIAYLIDIFFSIAVLIAITRYRLFDLRFVINRSLVYGIVTVAMLLLFVLLFVGVQAVLRAVLGNEQAMIAGASAAAVPFALFSPTRRTVGRFVDQRMFHLRFDLDQVAAAQKPQVKNPGMYTGRTFGIYEVLDVIGHGGMGEIYKGYTDGTTVALKVMIGSSAHDSEQQTRFTREAEVLSMLQHPHIVKLLTSGVNENVPFLAMEYINGEHLGEYLKRHGALSLDDACDILRDVAAALDYAHAQGYVHRDIKPSNIMLRKLPNKETLDAILMDFGIVKLQTALTNITGSDAIGTIDYMSPEQIMAARAVDKRSDIYSLGIVAYEMLTGERPFKGGAGQVLFAHLQQPPPDVRDVKPEIQRSVSKAIEKAMAKKAEERFESAGEFVAAL